MSGLVLLFPGRPLKPALKISGENRRRFYLTRFAGVSEATPSGSRVPGSSAAGVRASCRNPGRSESKESAYTAAFCRNPERRTCPKDDRDLQIQNGPIELFDPCKSLLSASSAVRFLCETLTCSLSIPAHHRNKPAWPASASLSTL